MHIHNDTIPEEQTSDFNASYSAYSLLNDAGDRLRDAIAACDNPITLQEVAQDLQDATERIAQRLSEVQARVERLYFPRPLVEVA